MHHFHINNACGIAALTLSLYLPLSIYLVFSYVFISSAAMSASYVLW